MTAFHFLCWADWTTVDIFQYVFNILSVTLVVQIQQLVTWAILSVCFCVGLCSDNYFSTKLSDLEYLAHWTVLPGRVRRSTSYTKINDHATFVCCLFCVTKTMVSMTVGLNLCIRIVSCLICRLYFQLLVVPHSTHERLDIEKITIRYDTIRYEMLF